MSRKSKQSSCISCAKKGNGLYSPLRGCQVHGSGARCKCLKTCAMYRCRGCEGYMVPPNHNKYAPYSCSIIKEAPKQLLCLRTRKFLNKHGKCC